MLIVWIHPNRHCDVRFGGSTAPTKDPARSPVERWIVPDKDDTHPEFMIKQQRVMDSVPIGFRPEAPDLANDSVNNRAFDFEKPGGDFRLPAVLARSKSHPLISRPQAAESRPERLGVRRLIEFYEQPGAEATLFVQHGTQLFQHGFIGASEFFAVRLDDFLRLEK
jgi:hypothetical protein